MSLTLGSPPADLARCDLLRRRIRIIVAVIIGYNSIEAIVALAAGAAASSAADSKQTLICSYLSAALLVGLMLNATLGWSWADPIAALVIAGWAVKEGLEALRGETCAVPISALTGEREVEACDC